MTSSPLDPGLARARVQAGQWDAWQGADLVLALYEPIFYSSSEDESHARVMAFADGRVLYRVKDVSGAWQWYVEELSADQVGDLRRSVVRDLAGAPRRFRCSAATHQRRSIVLVRHGPRWRVREGYALSACLEDIKADEVPASSMPVPPPPASLPAEGFVRAYRRLSEFHERPKRTRATPWHTPKLWLLWYPDTGSYPDERHGVPWPDELPTPPSLPRHASAGNQALLQPVDGTYDAAVRSVMPSGGLIEFDGERWNVAVHRQQPGDDTLRCAWARPWRRCWSRAGPRR